MTDEAEVETFECKMTENRLHVVLESEMETFPVRFTDAVKGLDGQPCTHEWEGTTLYITSASGTTFADLKGDIGPQGPIGPMGPQGESADMEKIDEAIEKVREDISNELNNYITIGSIVEGFSDEEMDELEQIFTG